jgi:hypothetical protein
MRAQLLGTVETNMSRAALYVSRNATRERRLQDIKYDRVGMFEMQGDNPWQHAPPGQYPSHPGPGSGGGGLTSNGNPSKLGSEPDVSAETLGNLPSQCSALEYEVKEIRRYLRAITERTADRDEAEKRAREWKVVALVLDRLFFFIYLCILILSAFLIFQSTGLDQSDADDPMDVTV